MFKAGRYTSFKNYLYAARGQHIKLGYIWTQLLERISKECVRSVLRGAGPSKRSLPLDINKVVQNIRADRWNYDDEDKPVDQLAVVLAGTYFMCREIELSGALHYEAHATTSGDPFSLLFPASKKDTEANGVTRSIDCLCDRLEVCPSHYLFEYLNRLRAWGDWMGIESDILPLFPTASGAAMSKGMVVNMVRNLVKSYDPEADTSRYTGHVFRITGARHYSDLGLDPVTIGIHGRWTSSAIMTYLAEAPLTSIRKRLGVLRKDEDPSQKTCFETASPEQRQELFNKAVEECENRHTAAEFQVPVVEDTRPRDHLRGFVINARSNRLHVRRVDSEQTYNFATKCGWKWAGKDHVFSCTVMPEENSNPRWVKCPKCFFEKSEESSSSESETSSTSEDEAHESNG